MKKLALVMLFGLALCGWVMAQEPITGNLAYTPTTDVMGAHENGGRGCAGCHAPHSGGRGGGGEFGIGTATPLGTPEGDTGLWGTDTGLIESLGSITFTGSYVTPISGLTWSNGGLYTGLVTCLSCHDGNYSRGPMMAGIAYEQAWGLLNYAQTAGSNGLNTVVLYGPNQIPTLLGADGGVLGDYSNDHPCGPMANLGKVFSSYATYMTVTYSGSGTFNGIVPTAGPFANFVNGYGYPALRSLVQPSGDTNPGDLYVVCTTCHNQHVQNVYSTLSYGASPIANGRVTAAAKIFYVNGPYNPGAPYGPQEEPSTMRFCQQCHFTMSSEYYGSGTAVGTAF